MEKLDEKEKIENLYNNIWKLLSFIWYNDKNVYKNDLETNKNFYEFILRESKKNLNNIKIFDNFEWKDDIVKILETVLLSEKFIEEIKKVLFDITKLSLDSNDISKQALKTIVKSSDIIEEKFIEKYEEDFKQIFIKNLENMDFYEKAKNLIPINTNFNIFVFWVDKAVFWDYKNLLILFYSLLNICDWAFLNDKIIFKEN